MRKVKSAEEQIAMTLRRHETGTTAGERCREFEISDTRFFRWQAQYGGMGVTALRALRSATSARNSAAGPLT